MEKKEQVLSPAEKHALVEKLSLLVCEQNLKIKDRNFEGIDVIEKKKAEIVKSLREAKEGKTDFSPVNKENNTTLQETLKKINQLFDEIIEKEKENEALLSSYEGELTGRHIEAYKRIR